MSNASAPIGSSWLLAPSSRTAFSNFKSALFAALGAAILLKSGFAFMYRLQRIDFLYMLFGLFIVVLYIREISISIAEQKNGGLRLEIADGLLRYIAGKREIASCPLTQCAALARRIFRKKNVCFLYIKDEKGAMQALFSFPSQAKRDEAIARALAIPLKTGD